MAAIPLFEGRVGSDIPAVNLGFNSPEVQGFREGLSDAAKLPSTTSAIAQGVREGVSDYQQQTLNQQRIEAQQLALEQEKAIQQDTIAAARLKAQQERLQYAQQIRLSTMKQQLSSELQDPYSDKSNILFSGKYNELFGADPATYKATLAAISPSLQEDQYRRALGLADDNTWKNYLLRQQAQVRDDYHNALNEFASNNTTKRILSDNGEYQNNPVALSHDIAFAKTLDVTEDQDRKGYVKYDDQTGKLLQPKKAVPDSSYAGGKPDFVAYSLRTGKILGRSLNQDYLDLQSSYDQAAKKQSAVSVGPEAQAEIIQQARKQKQQTSNVTTPAASEASSGMQPQTAQKQQGPLQQVTAPEETDEGDEEKPSTARAITPAPLTTLASNLSNTPITTADGKIRPSQNPVAVAEMVKRTATLPIPDAPELEKTFKNLLQAQENISAIDKYATDHPILPYNSFLDRFNLSYALEMSDAVSAFNDSRDTYIRTLLEKEFDANKDSLSKRYNESTLKNWKTLNTGKDNYYYAKTGVPLTPEVNTPRDLYVQLNWDRVAARVSSALLETHQQALRELTNKVDSGQAAQDALAALTKAQQINKTQ